MNTQNIISLYEKSGEFNLIKSVIQEKKFQKISFKNLKGSSDAVICQALFNTTQKPFLIILENKDDAKKLYNDISNLSPEKVIYLYPASFKKPYEFEEIDNANVLQRTYVLNEINENVGIPFIIISYSEALSEKVIQKKSLDSLTFSVKVGEKLDIEFMTNFLYEYDFEKSDFVFEAGQYSVRGGIIDVFSYSNEYPFRIEFFDDNIESIRSFDPDTQLSIKELTHISIIPNVKKSIVDEERQSFLNYLPPNTVIWTKNLDYTLKLIDEYFNKAKKSFESLLQKSNQTQVVFEDKELFETKKTILKSFEEHQIIEFGSKSYFTSDYQYDFQISLQPNFNNNFQLLSKTFTDYQNQRFKNYIVSDSIIQIERLEVILKELNPSTEIDGIVLGMSSGFIDPINKYTFFTDHEIFNRYYKIKEKVKYSNKKALSLKSLTSLNIGDFVVHIDFGIARFAGLETLTVNNHTQEVIRLVFRDDDLLYLSIHSLNKISKYSGDSDSIPIIDKLGSNAWESKKQKVKNKVKVIAKDLIELYAKRKSAPGFAFPKDNFLQYELETSFMYEDTPDQTTATNDVKADMEKEHPMDRLVCGDVGFGKTEVAIRAAFKAVNNQKQVAILVPTTILAMQHYNTFKKRLEPFGVVVDYINRFKTTKEITQTLKELKSGTIDIIIGTHRLVSKDVIFKDLRLLIIDEEQKFGVAVKEKIKEHKINIDVLSLTATPIPRTLHFSLMGARDLSVIATPPPNRRPVTTYISEFNKETIRDAISLELNRRGQVFFIHNRVNQIEEIANIIYNLVPSANIAIAHGQMEGKTLEKIMLKFIEGEYDVLVSTNIVESGLDVPNANTIIINKAHMFGLSDLHQMRGRVGRSNIDAYCYLMVPSFSILNSTSKKKLDALEDFSELGDGIKVAMKDLDIRGSGNLLGHEQSGFINDLGFDVYHKLLDEAVDELKENEFKELFATDLTKFEKFKIKQNCNLETDLELYIPINYISNTDERLKIYTKIDELKSEKNLESLMNQMKDRFGPLPISVLDLFKSIRFRWKVNPFYFDKVILKNETMKCIFTQKEKENKIDNNILTKLVKYINQNHKTSNIKETSNQLILTFQQIKNIDEAINTIEKIEQI